MKRHMATIALAGLVALAGDSAAQTADPGPVRVGDRWSYDFKDGVTGDLRQAYTYVVYEINDKEILTRMTLQGPEGRTQTAVYNLDWGLIDDGGWQYRPSRASIRTPLQVGKAWRWDAQAKNLRDGSVWRISGRARVAGQEQMTTRAGAFETFRIEAKERQVSTKNQTRSFAVTQVFWYAPAVNRWVKRTFEARFEGRVRDSVSEELTAYSRKP